MSIKPAKPSAQPITPWSSSRPTTKKKLPDAFLRRCFFHFIRFPSPEGLAAIVRLHFPHLKEDLLAAALTQFFDIREAPGLKKKPSTSEVLDRLKLLLADDLTSADLQRDAKINLPHLYGALLKNEQDVAMFEKLAFLARRDRLRLGLYRPILAR